MVFLMASTSALSCAMASCNTNTACQPAEYASTFATLGGKPLEYLEPDCICTTACITGHNPADSASKPVLETGSVYVRFIAQALDLAGKCLDDILALRLSNSCRLDLHHDFAPGLMTRRTAYKCCLVMAVLAPR